jgi:hypothetical protein
LAAVSEDQLIDGEPEENEGDDAAWDAWTHPGVGVKPTAAKTPGPARPKLTRRARVVIGTVLGLVLATAAALIFTQLGSGHSVNSGVATRQLDAAHSTLISHQRSCPASDAQLSCSRETAGSLSLAFRDFDLAVARIDVPRGAADAQNALEQDAELLSNAYDELSVASTMATYQRIFGRDDVSALTTTFDHDYAALVEAIRAG